LAGVGLVVVLVGGFAGKWLRSRQRKRLRDMRDSALACQRAGRSFLIWAYQRRCAAAKSWRVVYVRSRNDSKALATCSG
jgi:hypothetical protein